MRLLKLGVLILLWSFVFSFAYGEGQASDASEKSIVPAISSKKLLLQQIELLEKQNKALNELLDPNRVNLDTSALQSYLRSVKMQRDALELNIKFSQAKLQILLQATQQLNQQINSSKLTLPLEKVQDKVNQLSNMITFRQTQLDLNKQNLALAKQIIINFQNRLKQLEQSELKQKRQLAISKLKQKIRSLREQNSKLMVSALSTYVSNEAAATNVAQQQGRSSLAELTVSLNELEIDALQITIKLNYSDAIKVESDPLTRLNKLILRLENLAKRIQVDQKLIESIAKEQNRQIIYWQLQKQNALANSFKALSKQKEEISAKFLRLSDMIKLQLSQQTKQQKVILESRKGFVKDSLGQGSKLMRAFLELPILFGVYLKGIYLRVDSYLQAASLLSNILLGLVGLLSWLAWYLGKKYLTDYISSHDVAVHDRDLYLILSRVLSQNWAGICFMMALSILLLSTEIAFQSYKLLTYLFLVWFFFSSLISITRLALLETLSNVAGLDVNLYYRLRVTFTLGGIITIGAVLSHQLAVYYLIQELFDRLFMIFLFTASIVLLKGQRVIVMLLNNYINPKRFYTKRAMALFTLLIPIILLFNGAMGIIGYVQLAWYLTYYQAVIVFAVSAYIIIRGLLLDSMEAISEKMIATLENGWLWTESVLKPVHTILRYLIIFLLIGTVFRIYGWDSESSVAKALWDLWYFELFSWSKVTITTKSLTEFLVMVCILLWIARWSREFCYRWIFHGVVDQGLRNSLSVFSQYSIIGIGAIITLQVLGVDISGISMILGGLAVGMGFGLRDFANNIVGGMMLLIERPVKEGDLISVDNMEGRVTHIGIRSMRIKSWDNYEVIIPNADTFSKPFTNWTHKDCVVRTVLPIKVNRFDSPQKVQQLMIDVLTIIPEVLEDPEPQVYLKHIDEVLLEFEVRYHINVEQHSRVQVRSTVLFAIMAQFKAAGIKAPIPSLHIDYESSP